MHTLRTFFCLELDAASRHAIGRLATAVRAEVDLSARWVAEENYHVTVRFLGEIGAMLTLDLERAARDVCRRLRTFEISLKEVGAFPSFERPRVLWVGDRDSAPFRGLTTSLNAALRALDFPRDRADAIAHVTMARIKDRSAPRLEAAARKAAPDEPIRVLATRLTLMQSELTPHGARYAPLFTAPFGGSREDGD